MSTPHSKKTDRCSVTKVTQKVIDANREVIRSAMEAFVAQEALARFGYAPRDVVRTPLDRQEPAAVVPATIAVEPGAEVLSPSEGEMSALTYARNRLFFLVKNDILFKEVQKIEFRKAKTSFRVYYGKPNSGSLFDYKVQKGGKVVLVFPAIDDGETGPEPSGELDNYLLKAFTQRVASAGVSLDSAPVLRTIKGGQPGGAA